MEKSASELRYGVASAAVLVSYVDVRWHERLKDAIKSHGMTRAEFARQSGIPTNTLRRWIDAKTPPHTPSFKHLLAISRTLKRVRFEDVFDDQRPWPPAGGLGSLGEIDVSSPEARVAVEEIVRRFLSQAIQKSDEPHGR